MAARFLTAEWRELVMLNWEADPAILASRVPRGTELDFQGGRTFVSVVGFLFLRTRVLGVPIPLHRNFEELNLRFYVRRGDRRGVVFVKEIVPKIAIASTARALYNEPYARHPMRHIAAPDRVQYEFRKEGLWQGLAGTRRGKPAPLEAGSREEFIVEHYWGYTRQRDGGTIEYRVEHPKWSVWPALTSELTLDAASLYGVEFGYLNRRPPDSAFIAEGSPVHVYRGVRIV
ncbi:MAG: DUF2071 domain-containing protein [Bryobacteraceae bacterium]|nr:DUF2071 domain-containing protein [Bryobacteraceae bacterium]